jgi:hypothetical protein
MTGEFDLKKLIKGLKPEVNQGEYVYCLVSSQYFGVTVFDPRQIWEEKPFSRLSWHIWCNHFTAPPFF